MSDVVSIEVVVVVVTVDLMHRDIVRVVQSLANVPPVRKNLLVTDIIWIKSVMN